MSTATATAALDVPGLIRRVRRLCDLSQADLAVRLGVCQSTVARWETGATEPTLSMFQRLVALAGFQVEVRDDSTGEPARPMRVDGVRDGQGRRYPAHLDVLPSWPSPRCSTRDPDATQCAPRRSRRDQHRARENNYVAADHLSGEEVSGVLEDYHNLRLRRSRREQRLRREWFRHETLLRGEPNPDIPEPCFCHDDCFEHRGCLPGCPCLCEPMNEDAPQPANEQNPLF